MMNLNGKYLMREKDLISKKHNENEKYILVSSPEVTELLKGLVKKAIKIFSNMNDLNLAYYSTKFEDIK